MFCSDQLHCEANEMRITQNTMQVSHQTLKNTCDPPEKIINTPPSSALNHPPSNLQPEIKGTDSEGSSGHICLISIRKLHWHSRHAYRSAKFQLLVMHFFSLAKKNSLMHDSRVAAYIPFSLPRASLYSCAHAALPPMRSPRESTTSGPVLWHHSR